MACHERLPLSWDAGQRVLRGRVTICGGDVISGGAERRSAQRACREGAHRATAEAHRVGSPRRRRATTASATVLDTWSSARIARQPSGVQRPTPRHRSTSTFAGVRLLVSLLMLAFALDALPSTSLVRLDAPTQHNYHGQTHRRENRTILDNAMQDIR